MDHFWLPVSDLLQLEIITKGFLVSDIAKTYNYITPWGGFSPFIIIVKILLQKIWELKVDLDKGS